MCVNKLLLFLKFSHTFFAFPGQRGCGRCVPGRSEPGSHPSLQGQGRQCNAYGKKFIILGNFVSNSIGIFWAKSLVLPSNVYHDQLLTKIN